MAQLTINVGTANQGDGDPLRDAFVKANTNFTEIYGNDFVTPDRLAPRYTDSSAVTSASSITIDTSSADVFTWTAGHSATIDFTNAIVGDVVTLIVTGGGGSYTLTLQNINGSAGTFNKISGDYDDTSATKNIIEFKFISTSEAWYQISQAV